MDELQEALKDLRDIHEPDPIQIWPLAPGWWALFIITIILLFLLRRWLKRPKTPPYKKLALDELNNINNNFQIQRNSYQTAVQISELIRKIMILTDKRQDVGGLIGDEWLSYLDLKSKTRLFSSGAGSILTTGVYQPASDIDIASLLTATRTLIKNV